MVKPCLETTSHARRKNRQSAEQTLPADANQSGNQTLQQSENQHGAGYEAVRRYARQWAAQHRPCSLRKNDWAPLPRMRSRTVR